jgi:putative transposase
MLDQTPREQRQQLIDVNHRELSLRRQCQLLGVNRSTVYYKPREANAEAVDLLNEIRDIWERYPFYGYRRITKELQFKGHSVNFKRVRRLMKLGGIPPIYPGPNTSRRNKLHAIHPHFPKKLYLGFSRQFNIQALQYFTLWLRHLGEDVTIFA